MAFATKYRIEGTSDIYGKVTINIKKDGYSGSVINLEGVSRDFVTLKIGSPSNDISSTILPGTANIQYYCLTEFQTIELAQSEIFTFLVEINDSLGENIWTGWVMPEEYSESYTNTPYVVNIVASDFLDGLKNVSMGNLLTTKTTLWNALRTALAGTRLELRYLESISIYSDGMADTGADSPLTQAEVSIETFQVLTCYDAINIILKPFFARVYQYRGWRIENITEKRDNYVQRLYNIGGVYQTNTNSLSLVQLDNSSSNFKAFIEKTGQLNFKPSLNSANSYFQSIQRVAATGLQGFDKISDWTSTSQLVSWTNEGSIVIQRVATEYNGSEFGVWIDGKNDAVSANQYIQSVAIPVDPTNNENINIQFDYKMDYPSVIILGTKPILNVEFFLDGTSNDYYWTGTQWVTDRRYIRISASPRNAWRNFSANIGILPEAGDLYIRIHRLVKSGTTGTTKLFLTKFSTNIQVEAEESNVFLYANATSSIDATFKGPAFEFGIADGLIQGANGVMEFGSVLTDNWTRKSQADNLPITSLFLLQWLSFHQYSGAVLQGTLHQRGEHITPVSTIEDDPLISTKRYVLNSWEMSLGRGVGSVVYREIPQTDVAVTIATGTRSQIDSNDYLIPGIPAPNAPSPTPVITPQTPVINFETLRFLNGDVTGDISTVEITPAAIQNKARLDLTGLTANDIVIGAVKDSPDQENMTNLRLSDIKPLITPSVGAGLSLDSLNRIQIGNEDVGIINVTDSVEFPNGILFKTEEVVSGATFSTQSYLLNGDASLFSSQIDPVNDFNKFTVVSSVNNGASLSLNYIQQSTGNFGYAQFQTILNGGFNPLVNDLEARFSVYDQTNSNGGGISIIRNPTTGIYTLKVFDEQGQKGLIYDGDYESNFTARSLVTKQYVDGAISGSGHSPVTIGSPANGLSISGTQVLSIVLASASATGALSSTDWNTFNNKLNLTSLLTDYTVGVNTALAATDTILQAFGKVQGQINARISGTIASGRVAFGTGVNTVGGDAGLTWDNVNKRLGPITVKNPSVGTPIRAIGLSNYVEIGTSITDVGLIRTNAPTLQIFTNLTTNSLDITSTGIFIPVGRTITGENNNVLNFQNVSGNIYLGTTNANRHVTFGTNNIERARITDTFFGLYTTSPTNTLDVNGTTRIRTISNLGTAATSVLVPSATGVVSLRTLAELASDMSSVLFTAQTLTSSQKLQARTNIGSTSSTPQVIATAGAINDLAVTSNHLVFTGASVVLSGIAAGLDGEEFTILNASGTNLELLSQSALSAANNRFASGVIVPNLSIVRIKYRTTTARWVLENVGINDGRYVRKDMADSRTGDLTQNGSLSVNGNQIIHTSTLTGNAGTQFQLRDSSLTSLFNIDNIGRVTTLNSITVGGVGISIGGAPLIGGGASGISIKGINDGANVFQLFTQTDFLASRYRRTLGFEFYAFDNSTAYGISVFNSSSTRLFSVQGNGSVFANNRSSANNNLTRRDELYLNYSQTVATAGTINDLAINSDCKLLILSAADDLTGVVAVDNTRLIRIEARGGNRIIRHESASSTASNRFSIGADLTINAGEVYQFIYTDSRWRRVL